MAWTYLVESEVCPSPCQNGSALSLIVKSTPTVKQSCSVKWPIEGWNAPLYGTMLEHYLRNPSPERASTYCMVASHARTSVLLDMEKAWKESEADYFSRSCAFPKKSSPNSYSLKTSLQSPQEGDFRSLERLPKWGMIVDGVLYPLSPLEHYTSARGSSCWPTPNTMDHMALRSEEALKRQFLTTRKGRTKPSNLREAVNPECWPQNLFPTPCAQEDGKTYEQHMAMKAKMKRNTCSSLSALVQRFPTPKASDSKRNDSPCERNRDSPCLPAIVNMEASTTGKKLCPLFVELLMGYHTGWTELEPWATQWFLAKRKKRSKS